MKNIIVILILLFTLVQICISAEESDTYIDLANWQARWGDSPVDSSNIPLWIYTEQSSSYWVNVNRTDFYGNLNFDTIWLRTRCPDGRWIDPTVFLTAILYSVEVYVDSTRIYAFGEIGGDIDKYTSMHWHKIPLPGDAPGKWIYFRVYSNQRTHIGIPVMADNKAFIGSHEQVMSYIINASIDRFALGFLFILVGIMSLDLFFHRWQLKTYIYLPFALFTFCVGITFLFSAELSQFIFQKDAVRLSGSLVGALFFPVGLFMFYEYIVFPVHKRVIRMLWQSILLIAVIIVFLEFSNLVSFNTILYLIWVILILITFLVTFGFGIYGTLKGNIETKTFNIGFIIMTLFIVHDVLFLFGIIPFWRWTAQWGVLLFVLTLLHIIERRNLQDHDKLVKYSKELKDYGNTLEHRVKERTQDLRDKNKKLEETMQELQETQQQLILKEKMASLGHLVAGVAHELNNPIGAVSSAANVLQRGFAKVRSAIGSAKTVDDLKNETFTQTMEILEQNNEIVTEGSKRVARIVKSLKNFARLDEAEFQKADIHNGLDSTIDLLHHELKNRISITKEYDTLPPIHCFPNQLNQVFLNVIANAAQAIPGDGKINIKTRQMDSMAQIEISDNGTGILKEHLDHVFDPGFTTKGVGVGTGLGLSISYNIIKKHNGDISVKSEWGNGATFIIKLPLVQNI